MKSSRNTLGVLSVIVTLGLAAPAFAAEATPSHVYQLVDTIHSELTAIHKANGSKPKTDPGAPELTKRHPRHVIQKAREVLFKVELLRDTHDLPSNPVPDFPTKPVKPADVREMVDHILEELVELKPKFGVKGATAKAAMPLDMTPTDVYKHLEDVTLSLDGLGVRETRPFDVYRVALTAIHELEQIREKLGISKKINMERHSGKKPEDVYEKTYELLADLKHMTEARPNLAVPGGVVLANKRSGEIKAKHIMGLMNHLLAEVGAIKVKLGIKTPMQFAMPKSGPVPSNVYDAILMADLLVKQIEKGG